MSERPRRALAGVWAFALSLVPVLWLLLALVLALAAAAGNEVAAMFASPIAIGSFAIVPIFSLMAIVLAVVSLAVSTVVGKVFGALALLLVIGEIVLVIALIGGASALPGTA